MNLPLRSSTCHSRTSPGSGPCLFTTGNLLSIALPLHSLAGFPTEKSPTTSTNYLTDSRKTANALVSSSDFLAYEDLRIRNMVRNRHLSNSISDASWGTFLQWVKYYATVHTIPIVAVPPQFTSQDCSGCGTQVKKSLSVRTHICPTCGIVLDRDENAAKNILHAGLTILFLMAFAGTLGHRGTSEDSENASGQSASPRRSPRRKASKQAG